MEFVHPLIIEMIADQHRVELRLAADRWRLAALGRRGHIRKGRTADPADPVSVTEATTQPAVDRGSTENAGSESQSRKQAGDERTPLGTPAAGSRETGAS
jgi:hypothetical protein